MSDPDDARLGLGYFANEALSAARRGVRGSSRRFNRALRVGVLGTARAMRQGDAAAQTLGITVLAFGIYREWKKRQHPVQLYTTHLDMDETVGVRLLRKGKVIGEFPISSVRE